jgi:threonine/homoserine/homoserine lactone efflux protein
VEFLFIGLLLGLSSGISPGPLLTLVIAETLRYGLGAGIRVAITPFITDLPIILLTLIILSRLANYEWLLGVISLVGGIVLLIMGFDCLMARGVVTAGEAARSNSLIKGILANLLNPHPYLFWFSVGAPLMTQALGQNAAALIGFIVGFYLFLVGSKVILAVMVARSAAFLSGRIYLYVMRFLGAMLGLLAVFLFYDGLNLLRMNGGGI